MSTRKLGNLGAVVSNDYDKDKSMTNHIITIAFSEDKKTGN